MGATEKLHQMDGGGIDSENWAISGVSLVNPLKPVFTRSQQKQEDSDDELLATTPTSEGSRIPSKLACPPAPKKRRPCSSGPYHIGRAREFFKPPELETIFTCHVNLPTITN